MSSKSAQTPARKRLIELMQTINFGRIENLMIQSGSPVFDDQVRIIREIKIGGDNEPRPERRNNNFSLKSQVIELFQHLHDWQHCMIILLEVKHGLPFRLLVSTH